MPRPHALLVSAALWLASALSAQTPDSSRVTLERVFASDEFTPEFLGQVRWLAREAAYTKLEPDSATPPGRALVRYDAATGRRDVWVPAARLVPPGDTVPLTVEDYSVSPDGRRILIFTNSRKVWRQNTRGDYWALDLAAWRLQKLGGADARPSTLMFAKFSPDGSRVAYVREHNLYVEDLAGGRVTPLTSDGSPHHHQRHLRLGLRGGAQPAATGSAGAPTAGRSPTGSSTPRGVRDFLLIDDTDSLYSFTIPVQYPKAGQPPTRRARVGVVSAAGGPTTWLERARRPTQQLHRAHGVGGEFSGSRARAPEPASRTRSK